MQKLLKSLCALIFCVLTVYPDLVASTARAEEEPVPGFYACMEKIWDTAATLECPTVSYVYWDRHSMPISGRRRTLERTR